MSKFDIEKAEKLKSYSYKEIAPIIPDLLMWLQDMNWPVAPVIAKYLRSISEELSDEIIRILNGKDEMWKYWTIEVFGIRSEKKLDPKIIEILHSIAYTPSPEEKEYEVDLQAIEALKANNA